MKLRYISIPIGLLLASAGGALMMAAKRGEAPVANDVKVLIQPRHPVTPEMWKQADGAKGIAAPEFEVTDLEGTTHSLADLTKNGPLFLYFVLDGCPCSIEAEPHYERLHQRFRKSVNFLAVTSAAPDVAKKWKSDFGVPYPVVSESNLDLMHLYGVTRSVYCLLIDKDQKIIKMWPGYGAAMLQDVNRQMEIATGQKTEKFDPLSAPEIMTSGCEFPSPRHEGS